MSESDNRDGALTLVFILAMILLWLPYVVAVYEMAGGR